MGLLIVSCIFSFYSHPWVAHALRASRMHSPKATERREKNSHRGRCSFSQVPWAGVFLLLLMPLHPLSRTRSFVYTLGEFYPLTTCTPLRWTGRPFRPLNLGHIIYCPRVCAFQMEKMLLGCERFLVNMGFSWARELDCEQWVILSLVTLKVEKGK